jgi:hypothetical protein
MELLEQLDRKERLVELLLDRRDHLALMETPAQLEPPVARQEQRDRRGPPERLAETLEPLARKVRLVQRVLAQVPRV